MTMYKVISFSGELIIASLAANNKKIPLQKFSDLQGRVNATYWLKEHVQVDGYIDGHIEKVYFYGAEAHTLQS